MPACRHLRPPQETVEFMHQYATVSSSELIRKGDQLRLLMQVSEAIATQRDLPALCRDLAERLPAIVPFEFIALVLHDLRAVA